MLLLKLHKLYQTIIKKKKKIFNDPDASISLDQKEAKS